MKRLLFIVIFAGALSAQNVTVPMGNLLVPNEAATAFESWRLTQQVALASPISLSIGINASVTTFALVGDLSQLAVGNQITIGSEAMTITGISVQNVTVAARNAIIVGGVTISTPATHPAGFTVVLLRWSSAVAGFKQLILQQVQQVLQSYCPGHPTVCPTLATQYTVLATANAAITAILAAVVQ